MRNNCAECLCRHTNFLIHRYLVFISLSSYQLDNEVSTMYLNLHSPAFAKASAGRRPRLRRFLNNRTKSVFKKGVMRCQGFLKENGEKYLFFRKSYFPR